MLGLAVIVDWDGSSPLTRGKREVYELPRSTKRLIPAHAGKTQVWPFHAAFIPAHPRSRGENQDVSELVRLPSGSSPLTRGKPVKRRRVRVLVRLIPAHAGKTQCETCGRR